MRLIVLVFLLLLSGGAFAQPIPSTGCTTTKCTGTALPLGYLTVAGNQLQSGPGNNVRLACAVYRGTGVVADFQAIRAAGFNCVRLDWRDAYLSAVSPPAGCNSLTQIQSCVANAKTAGLAVIFNHLGNEIPVAGSACHLRQQNGLWFDSGSDSGGSDGCGDIGTVTAATFQTNTVNLLSAFNNNAAVIGYEFHNEPLISGTFTRGGTGSFSIKNGRIIDPNGKIWTGAGFGTGTTTGGGTATNWAGEFTNSAMQPATTWFPKLNFVRSLLAFSDVEGGITHTAIDQYAQWAQANGIVLLIGLFDYQCVLSNGQLTRFANWVGDLAAAYKNNPYIWFQTENRAGF